MFSSDSTASPMFVSVGRSTKLPRRPYWHFLLCPRRLFGLWSWVCGRRAEGGGIGRLPMLSRHGPSSAVVDFGMAGQTHNILYLDFT